MTPIAIYARYSTDKQDARSIDDQVRRCREHAAAKGLEVVAEFSDAAVSGTHTERAQLRRMLDVATATKRPPFRAVLVDDLSRLSRDVADTHSIIAELLSVGVRLLDVSVGLDSEREDAELTIGMHALINSQYVRAIAKQTHRGLDGRARAGFSTGGSLFGFRTRAEANPSDAEHPRKLWEHEPTDSDVVLRIFRMFDQGACSYRTIADDLNRAGVAAPRNNGRGGKHGNGWSHVTVRAILRNAKYVGEWTWNTHKWTRVPGRKARRRRARPEAEHVTRSYPELAIVDRATWERVQARMSKRGPSGASVSGTRKGQQTTLVSGLLRCGTCGGPMSVRSAKVKAGVRYVNYGCTSHSSRGGSVCPNGETISERKVSDALVEALREVLDSPEVREIFARAFSRRVDAKSKPSDVAGLERELNAAERRVSNATRLIVEMPDDLDLRRQREADKADVRRLTDAIAAAKGSRSDRPVPDSKAVAAAMGRFVEGLTSKRPEAGRETLARCVGRLVVTPKNEGPGRFRVTGTVDLAQVAASGSSGGTPVPLASLPYPLDFAA